MFQTAVQTVIDKYGQLDCLINNAGISKCHINVTACILRTIYLSCPLRFDIAFMSWVFGHRFSACDRWPLNGWHLPLSLINISNETAIADPIGKHCCLWVFRFLRLVPHLRDLSLTIEILIEEMFKERMM